MPMRTFVYLLTALMIICTNGFADDKAAPKPDAAPDTKAETPLDAKPEAKPKNPYAVISTSKGDITVELFADAAPKTVANFTGLAEGTTPFKDPKTGEMVKRPYYDGLIFHRVIKKFMIQGGDILGTGTGGPGYAFEDEIDGAGLGLNLMMAMDPNKGPHPWLGIHSQQDFQQKLLMPLFRKMGIANQAALDARMNDVNQKLRIMTLMEALENMGYTYTPKGSAHKPVRGALAMANAGPDTNGSQFFINLVDTEWLTGKHTVFGKVVQGMDVVDAIGNVPVDQQSRPIEPVAITSIRITPDPPPLPDVPKSRQNASQE